MVQNSGREMEKPLIIGKFMKPKCFKHLDISKFPVEWQKKKINKKAWMTSSGIEYWPDTLNKVKKRNQKVLDSTCHPNVNSF